LRIETGGNGTKRRELIATDEDALTGSFGRIARNGELPPRGGVASIKVLLADYTECTRRAIIGLLSQQPTIELLGEAADFTQTVEMANDLKPQVIVMDLHMLRFRTDYHEVKSHLNHGSRLLAISLENDDEAKFIAHGCGAVMLLDKMHLAAELIPTIMMVAQNTGTPVTSTSSLGRITPLPEK